MRKKWTEEEKKIVGDQLKEGKKKSDLALLLSRTKGSIYAYFQRLNKKPPVC